MARLAIKAKIYWRSGGSYGSPTWSELDDVSDLTSNQTWEEASADSRASVVKLTVKTMLQLDISGKYKIKLDNAGYIALADALASTAVLDILVLNQARTVEGARGWRADCQVFSGSEDQALANALYMDFALKPTCSDNLPKIAKVGAGPALVYATPGEATASFA